jgi:hypothetical protein
MFMPCPERSILMKSGALPIPEFSWNSPVVGPNTGNPNDGLYSAWKIRWENIIRWSKRCTETEMDPAEFEANTQKAREIP